MKVLRAYKTELDPNNKQRTKMAHCCGAARYVYNWGLAEWKAWYERGDKPSGMRLCKHFNGIKDEFCPWIREIPYAVTESAFRNLDSAFRHFFRRVKSGEKPGYPKFKKRGANNGFQLRDTKIEDNRVRLTGIGWVRLKEKGYIPTTDSEAKFGVYATISERAGRWFISVLVQEEIPEPINGGNGALGVDLGIKALATCSDGTVFENPRALRKEERKLKRLQRELSRRTRGGKNWHKTKDKITCCHKRIADIRSHAQHQVSHYVTAKARPGTIVLENLNVSGMTKNHCLARAISDVGMYELRRQIEYKAEWYGCGVLIANRFYPSSKTCSECGSIKPQLKLSERRFVCPDCGIIIDRDLNAALNLASLALL